MYSLERNDDVSAKSGTNASKSKPKTKLCKFLFKHRIRKAICWLHMYKFKNKWSQNSSKTMIKMKKKPKKNVKGSNSVYIYSQTRAVLVLKAYGPCIFFNADDHTNSDNETKAITTLNC